MRRTSRHQELFATRPVVRERNTMVNFRFGTQSRPSGWTAFVFASTVGVVLASLFTRLAANDDQGIGATSGPQKIMPGAIWPDDRGEHVQAHGGGVIRVGDTYFWFGEQRAQGLDRSKCYVSCYSSHDLAHWTFRKNVLEQSDPENFGPRWILERPKVFYNATTKKYVMYMHIDGPAAGSSSGYQLACVGVATSDTVDGDYQYIRSFRPLGKESRDIGQFIDDDGTAYLIFEERPAHGFRIAKLSADYLDVETSVAFVQAPLEGGAVVHYDGLYYAVGSHLTSWAPNPNLYATAPRLEGPLVGVQGYLAARDKYVWLAVDNVVESGGNKVDDGDLYGRHLEAVDPVGFAIFVDALGNRQGKTPTSRAAGVDTGRRNGRSRD